jgi:hypothetical protein
MTSHTDGPWRYEYTDPGETDCNLVVSYVSMDADDEGRTRDYGGSLLEGLLTQDDAENEANARLIAAAPGLLDALQWVISAFGETDERQRRMALDFARNAVILALDGPEAADRALDFDAEGEPY